MHRAPLVASGAPLDVSRCIPYHSAMLTAMNQVAALALGSGDTPNRIALVQDPAGQLAILLAVLAAIFWATQHPLIGRIFKIIPSLVFCYFVPTLLTTLGVIPDQSSLYAWVKDFVLPASLLLLILSLDVPGIIRLGPKAVIMLLAGTTGVVIGGPISLWICGHNRTI